MASLGAVILGASFDTVEENRAFAEAQEFPFRLLSDPDHRVGAAFGVERPASDAYAAYPRRFSFLVDPDGIVRAVYDVTDVRTHADDVLADLRALAGDA